MESQKKHVRSKRRTNVQLDSDVMHELEGLVCECGFGNVNLTSLMKRAGIEANVFYRRYGTMDQLYDTLAKEYDFWINDAIDISSLNTLGPKKFFSVTFKKLYENLLSNNVMQKLLIWELTTDNSTTRRTSEIRDVMNLNLIAFYDKLFEPAKVNIKGISAMLIAGLYYLILHRERAGICSIDFNTPDGEKSLYEAIDQLTDMIFWKLEMYNEKKQIAARMVADGVSNAMICKFLAINKGDLEALLAK